ncbi:MAG TPA: beta-propeller domain-containing protein, partial [Gemmatimonadales bacterium]|nr:beta-propeller domain-containing protein [Gemmatimonadales bacterium]
PHATLRSFGSDAELLSYFRRIKDERERARQAADSAYRLAIQKAAKCSSDSLPRSIVARPASSLIGADAVIRGRTLNAGNQPQSAVVVTVPELSMQTMTGADGRYRFAVPAESLPASRQLSVRVARIGYQTVTRTLTLARRDSVELDLRLCDAGLALQQVVVSGAAAAAVVVDGIAAERADEQVTNTQHAGVDEGGIVKVHGDYLVILRRGRLFTVAIGGSDLEPIAATNAFGPDVDPQGTWYDELLVSGSKVVVIGYSYDRGGTEVGVFNIDARGRLSYVATYELRSNDYYSDRNYASRLIGTKLIFYAPLYLWDDDDVFAALPAVRRWYRGAHDTAFKRIAPATRIYRGPQSWTGDDLALHTVTICDLSAANLGCQATSIVGPSGRVFYVSPRAVYVWASSWSRAGREEQEAILYRMPLDGSSPSALGVSGSPVDQFSFLESETGQLNVLVRSDAYGDAMWLPEWASGDVALLRVPIRAFGDGTDRVPWWNYRRLPIPRDADEDAFHNRFVGNYLLYGMGSGWGPPQSDSATLFVVPWTDMGGDRDVTRLRLGHGVDRIEPMGSDAVIVGADSSDLHFTGIRLGSAPAIAQRYTLPDATQGELRSHGFFYRMDGPDAGVLGLPVSESGRPGYRHLIDGSAGVVFLRNRGHQFVPLGTLRTTAAEMNDGCVASCVDWYGNARPLFLRGRIFALLGYELVEGAISGDAIQEMRRVTFAPRQQTVAR